MTDTTTSTSGKSIGALDELSQGLEVDLDVLRNMAKVNKAMGFEVSSIESQVTTTLKQVIKRAVDKTSRTTLDDYERQVNYCRHLIDAQLALKNDATGDPAAPTGSAPPAPRSYYRKRELPPVSTSARPPQRRRGTTVGGVRSFGLSPDMDRTPTQADFFSTPVASGPTASAPWSGQVVAEPLGMFGNHITSTPPAVEPYDQPYTAGELAPTRYSSYPPSLPTSTTQVSSSAPGSFGQLTKIQITHWLVQNVPTRHRPMSQQTLELLYQTVIQGTPTPPGSNKSSLCCQCQECVRDLQNTVHDITGMPGQANPRSLTFDYPFASREWRSPVCMALPQFG